MRDILLAWMGGMCSMAVCVDIRRKQIDARTYECGLCAVFAVVFMAILAIANV